MIRLLCALLAVGLFLVAPAASGEAAVYVYVDEAGTAHYTDAPTQPYFRPLPAFGLPRNVDLVRGQYADLINRISAEEGVDAALVRAIIKAESNFDPRAVSRKGAQGLMQLMPPTAGRYAVENVFDPEANIRGGVRYLRFLHDMFPGQPTLALAAYNAGEHVVLRYNGVPPYPETRQYVARVLAFYGRRDLGGGRLRPGPRADQASGQPGSLLDPEGFPEGGCQRGPTLYEPPTPGSIPVWTEPLRSRVRVMRAALLLVFPPHVSGLFLDRVWPQD